VRLLTLTGPGGTGKTRLALQVATDLQSELTQGAVFVDLSAVRLPDLVLPTIGQQLGVREANERTIPEAVARILGDETLLLVIDNFEQVLGAAGDVGALLQEVPGLKILVTSREPLHLRWEHEFPVTPLPVPADSAGADLAAMASVPSVALFVERAQALQPAFELTNENARLVAEMCRRLDGLPLAIELAASRLRVLPLPALFARLEARLDLLKSNTRDAPDRHQTLREAIRWSYDLLAPDERALFRRLAVFSGGFTLEAIEAVCAGDGLLAEEMLDYLDGLVQKSLVVAEVLPDGSARYRLLETLREFGREQLGEAGENAALRARHCAWCVALAEQAAAAIWSAAMPSWLDLLDREHDNLRGALDWAASTSGEGEPGLRIVGAIWPFWDVRGHLREGQEHAERLLSQAGADVDPVVRARALDAAAWLAVVRRESAAALVHAEAAEELWRHLDDPGGLAWSLVRQGMLRYNLGEFDRSGAAMGEGLSLARVAGDPVVLFWAIFAYAHLRWAQGDLPGAEAHLQEMLAGARGVAPWCAAWALMSLGLLDLARGDVARAMVWQREALSISWGLKDMRNLSNSIGVTASLMSAMGHPMVAARLFGSAEVLREASGSMPPPWLDPVFAQAIERTRAALGQVTFDVAWAEGRATPLEEVVETALADPTPAQSTASSPDEVSPASPLDEALQVLTAREREVASLIARGMTSPEIAEVLVVSERTVDAHADHIRTKLNLRSRAEIAAWATAHGLRTPDTERAGP
jgi:non-specific serine/threonine protein kinase